MTEKTLPVDVAEAKTLPMNEGSAPADISDPDAEIAVVAAEQRYERRAPLGEGGMGEVCLCRDRVIGREVAMKVVHASQALHLEARARFVREARVQGQLEHPAIVPVYDFGTDADGLPFFTMKRVRGVTLEAVVDALRAGEAEAKRTYTMHRLLAAFVQACLAVDYAHERGVIHRDLKPANVMLGGYGEVYVLDWGLAKVRSASQSFDSLRSIKIEPGAPANATAAGALLGTPGYMAPEQILGEEVGSAADVYALGEILFELLTLEPLHGTGNAAALMKRALDGVDARPSARAPDREVAPELDAICVRACARDPKARAASAREIADAIEAYLAGDRDVELRATLARQHVERARSTSDRAAALRELGRAVALAPADETVNELLSSILLEEPKQMPAEVQEAVEATRIASQRKMLPRIAGFYLVAWPVLLPLVTVAHRPELIAFAIGAWTAAATVALLVYRWYAALSRLLWVVIATTTLAVAATSVVTGPLLVLPAMVLTNTICSLLITRRSLRRFLLVCNVAALVVPTLLAWNEHFPVLHEVGADGALRIAFAAFPSSRAGVFVALGAVHVALLAVGSLFAIRLRDALTEVERQRQLQAWKLRQLVPAEASRALAAVTKRPRVA